MTLGAEAGAQTGMDFRIRGMDCAEECAILRAEVGPLVGGDDKLSFDILRGRMSVAGAPVVPADAVIKAVARTGMRADVWTTVDESTAGGDEARIRRRRMMLTVASGAFGATAFVTHAIIAGGITAALGSEGLGLAHDVPWAVRGLYLASILSGTWYILPRAWFSARSLRPDMNLLMVIAVIGAMDALDSLREGLASLERKEHRIAGKLFRDVLESMDLAAYFSAPDEKCSKAMSKWYRDEYVSHGEYRKYFRKSHGDHPANELTENSTKACRDLRIGRTARSWRATA